MNEFVKLIQEQGEPKQHVLVTSEDAERYRGRVPDALIAFWLEHGRGCFNGGKDWLCDPAPFDPVIEAVFQGDPELRPDDLVAFKQSAFAELMLWNRKIRGPVTVNFNMGNVAAFGQDTWIDTAAGHRYSDDFIIGALVYRSSRVPAWVTDDDEDMLPLAVKLLGPLDAAEIYGFFPALQLGGSNEVENLRKVKAVEHLLFLTQITDFELARTVFPDPNDPGGYVREVVRRIGK